MSLLRIFFCGVLLVSAVFTHAQSSTKHFAKDGLSFDYLDGWTLTDQSDADAQQVSFTRAESDAQIKIFVHRGKVDTPAKFAEARRAFIDPYVKSVNDMFMSMGAKPERTTATAEISGAPAEGVKLRASLGGQPGEAAVYWLTLNSRVTVLTFFGPDQALKQAASAWNTIRTTIKVESAQPNSSPKPASTPKP